MERKSSELLATWRLALSRVCGGLTQGCSIECAVLEVALMPVDGALSLSYYYYLLLTAINSSRRYCEKKDNIRR